MHKKSPNKILVSSILVAFSLSGCSMLSDMTKTQQDTAKGAGIGAAGGAVVGAIAGGTKGAVIGAAVGVSAVFWVVGAVVGLGTRAAWQLRLQPVGH